MTLAELPSGIGALILGTGLGAPFPHWCAPAAGFIALAGVVAHAFGMWDPAHEESWVVALYWVCWLLLAGVVMFLFMGR